MTKKILAILLALSYSIAYTIVGPMIKNQRIDFQASLILPFLLCFLFCLAGNLLLFSVVPRMNGILNNEKVSQFLDRIGDRRLMLFSWAFCFMDSRLPYPVSRCFVL